MLHYPGGTLAAQHAFIDRVIAVTFDIADRTILEVDFDSASTCAHVTGGGFDGVADRRVEIDLRFSVHYAPLFPALHRDRPAGRLLIPSHTTLL